jgi:predicted DNA-binding transcriptional regulator AlpA
MMGTPRTVAEVLKTLRALPPRTSMDAEALAGWLDQVLDADDATPAAIVSAPEPTWRERLWTAPAETRIGVGELQEALGRSRSWIYKQTASERIPFRRLDGELEFLVGEIRAWLREREIIVVSGPMESTPGELKMIR